MRLPRWFRPLLVATAVFVVSIYPTLLEAQGQGRQGPPPRLHDRTLPPGKPFDSGDFQPPGRGQQVGDTEEDPVNIAARLNRLLADPIFPEGGILPAAVDAFNALVLNVSLAELEDPSEAFVAAHRTLRGALAMDMTARMEPYREQDTGLDELRRAWYLPGGTVPTQQVRQPWSIPGMAAATPTGFGADFGTLWVGASYQPKARYSDGQTGAAAAGFGLGDAERLVGLQVAINSFSTVSSGFGNRMGVDLHLHRTFGEVWSLAVGWESIGAPRIVTFDSGESRYVAGSRWLQFREDPDAPFGLAMLSLGVGTGRFQTETRFLEDPDGLGVFGSFGVRVAPPVTLIAEWTGQDVLLATSVTPLRNQRLALIAGVTEVTGAAGDGARFTIGGTLGFSFR